MTDHLQPGTLTLWVEKIPPRLLADLRLRADATGRVEIRQRFWKHERGIEMAAARVFAAQGERGDVAPMVLVYAELLALADARTIETARLVRERWIDGPFKRYRDHQAR